MLICGLVAHSTPIYIIYTLSLDASRYQMYTQYVTQKYVCTHTYMHVYKMCVLCVQVVCTLCTRCVLCVQVVYSVYKLCVLRVQDVCTLCTRCVYSVYKLCVLRVQDVHCVYKLCVLCVQVVCTPCTRCVLCVQVVCTPCTRRVYSVQSHMKRLCISNSKLPLDITEPLQVAHQSPQLVHNPPPTALDFKSHTSSIPQGQVNV